MDKEHYAKAKARINQHLQEAYAALAKAQDVAIETGVGFYWDGPTYGMGGDFEPSEHGQKDEYGYEQDGWTASSQQGC